MILRIFLSAFLLVCSASISFGNASKKPNIIFLLTDDQRFDALGCMGNTIIQTPHIDKLAAKGILFTNAHVTSSICAMSRATIMTGQYVSRHGIADFDTDFTPQALSKTYFSLLKNAGYQIGFIGKFGVGVLNQPKYLFDYWSCTELKNPNYILKNAKGDIVHHTDSVNSDIQKFLQLQKDNDKPFCLSVSFKAPHEQDGTATTKPSFIPLERYNSLYKNIKIPRPHSAREKYWNSFPDFFRTDSNVARDRWIPLLSTEDLRQETSRNYYRLITGVDEVVGKTVNTLQKLGLAENTVIIFTSDNGFLLGEHGLEGKWYGFEESIRVPLIVYDPRQSAYQGKKSNAMALNIDLAPTMLSLAGLKPPAAMQGVNLFDVLSGKIKDRHDFFYEHNFLGTPLIPYIEGVVSNTWKYFIFTEHDYEQLFNIKKDPYEIKNFASDHSHRSQLLAMRQRYKTLKRQVR